MSYLSWVIIHFPCVNQDWISHLRTMLIITEPTILNIVELKQQYVLCKHFLSLQHIVPVFQKSFAVLWNKLFTRRHVSWADTLSAWSRSYVITDLCGKMWRMCTDVHQNVYLTENNEGINLDMHPHSPAPFCHNKSGVPATTDGLYCNMVLESN